MAAAAGAAVSVNYAQSADAARGARRGHRSGGREGFAVQADVAEDGALDRAMDEAVARLGPLHGLVVSAGIFEGAYLRT